MRRDRGGATCYGHGTTISAPSAPSPSLYHHQQSAERFIMTPPLYQSGSRDPDQADVNYEETIYHMQPAYPPSNNEAFNLPTNPPGYAMFRPAAWQPDMNNNMAFMDALQAWGPPPTTNGTMNDPRSVTMGMDWQQPIAWDVLGRNMTTEAQILHTAPIHSPYPVQTNDAYERTIFKTEKPAEDTWDAGWVEEIPPPLHAGMHLATTIPHAVATNTPVQRPVASHAPRKRRRVPSPTVELPVFDTIRMEPSTRSPEEQYHTGPPPTSMFLEFGHMPAEPLAPSGHHFPPQSRERPRTRESTPTLEEMPDYEMENHQSDPTPSTTTPHSPELSARFIGPVPATRTPASKMRRGTHAVFKTQSANSKRGHYASDVWEGHKTVIKKLYIEEGKPLREVIKIMETEHDFPAT